MFIRSSWRMPPTKVMPCGLHMWENKKMTCLNKKGPLRARWSKVSNNNYECKCRLKAAILQHNACMHVAPSNSKDKQTPRRKGPTNTKENTPNTKEKNTKEKSKHQGKKCKHQGKKRDTKHQGKSKHQGMEDQG